MQAKLTLRMEERLIARAKTWARKHHVSLSQAVASLFEQLPAPPGGALTSWTQRLVGVAARRKKRHLSDEAIRRAHLDHLDAKHR
jgi:Family of unknown function (DUF6364)